LMGESETISMRKHNGQTFPLTAAFPGFPKSDSEDSSLSGFWAGLRAVLCFFC
jgi:hypothetical protein